MQERIDRTVAHCGFTVPTFLYGTAWKEEQTQELVQAALESGFIGIDTANQRRHYYEAGVGKALSAMAGQGRLERSALFLQSKFTYAAGQDHRLPFNPEADFPTQVRQSLASSLDHLGTSYLDSLILHGPATLHGFSNADREVWRTMEQLQQEGATRMIGVSNVGRDQLTALLDWARIKPAFVQNRCFARSQWDARIRSICRVNEIRYQGFSLLTANQAELSRPELHALAARLGRSVPQLIFRFCLQAGMIPLTGTTSRRHMHEDLEAYDFELGPAEMQMIETISQ